MYNGPKPIAMSLYKAGAATPVTYPAFQQENL